MIEKGKKIAAHLLEASEADIEFKDGKFTVAGTDKAGTLGEIALTAYVPHNYPHDELEPGLEETAFYDPKNFTFPRARTSARSRSIPRPASPRSSNFTAVDDFGNIINPMIVEGQVHGGIAQGIGQALLENCVYDRERPAADRLVSWTTHAARRRPADLQGRHDAARPARTTRSASRAAARPARSARRRR